MKIAGYIVEQKNVFHFKTGGLFGKRKTHHEWVRFSNKIYRTEEIARQAYENCPYGGGDSGYNMAGRIIPVYRLDENEKPKIIRKS